MMYTTWWENGEIIQCITFILILKTQTTKLMKTEKNILQMCQEVNKLYTCIVVLFQSFTKILNGMA